MAAQRPSIFACLTRSVRNVSLASPTLCECRHRSLARCRVAMRRCAVLVVSEGERPHPCKQTWFRDLGTPALARTKKKTPQKRGRYLCSALYTDNHRRGSRGLSSSLNPYLVGSVPWFNPYAASPRPSTKAQVGPLPTGRSSASRPSLRARWLQSTRHRKKTKSKIQRAGHRVCPAKV
jgi:hypothetical protein